MSNRFYKSKEDFLLKKRFCISQYTSNGIIIDDTLGGTTAIITNNTIKLSNVTHHDSFIVIDANKPTFLIISDDTTKKEVGIRDYHYNQTKQEIKFILNDKEFYDEHNNKFKVDPNASGVNTTIIFKNGKCGCLKDCKNRPDYTDRYSVTREEYIQELRFKGIGFRYMGKDNNYY